MRNVICVITDLTDADLSIKKMYCNDVLSILDALGSGDSIKKGNIMTLLLHSFIIIKIGKKTKDNFLNIRNMFSRSCLIRAISYKS